MKFHVKAGDIKQKSQNSIPLATSQPQFTTTGGHDTSGHDASGHDTSEHDAILVNTILVDTILVYFGDHDTIGHDDWWTRYLRLYLWCCLCEIRPFSIVRQSQPSSQKNKSHCPQIAVYSVLSVGQMSRRFIDQLLYFREATSLIDLITYWHIN